MTENSYYEIHTKKTNQRYSQKFRNVESQITLSRQSRFRSSKTISYTSAKITFTT